MGECRAAGHIAQGEDPGHVGLELIVHRDEAALGYTDSGCGGVQSPRVRTTARGQKQVRAAQDAVLLGRSNLHLDT